jgi:hypothetical protein
VADNIYEIYITVGASITQRIIIKKNRKQKSFKKFKKIEKNSKNLMKNKASEAKNNNNAELLIICKIGGGTRLKLAIIWQIFPKYVCFPTLTRFSYLKKD